MRAALIAALLATGCGASRAHGPAWPKMAERESDGGEPIVPRTGAAAAAIALADAADTDDDDDDIKVVAPAAAVKDATPTPGAATTPAATTEDPIQVDDIIIEIDD